VVLHADFYRSTSGNVLMEICATSIQAGFHAVVLCCATGLRRVRGGGREGVCKGGLALCHARQLCDLHGGRHCLPVGAAEPASGVRHRKALALAARDRGRAPPTLSWTAKGHGPNLTPACVQIAISLGQLYGDVLYFATTYVEGAPPGPYRRPEEHHVMQLHDTVPNL